MYKGKSIGVVVPAYNEEEFVGEVIATVPSFVDRVYPIDDCSTDDTWAEIQHHISKLNDQAGGNSEQRVVPLRHEQNRGVGGAIKTGYARALRDGIDVIAVMNGDGQMDPDMLDRIVAPIVEGRAGYTKGNRLRSPDHWDGMPRWRLFGNFVLTYLTRIASGYWNMIDPQNGYTAVSADVLERVEIDDLYEGFGFLNDLLVRLNVYDVRIAEVEMGANYGEEQSSITYRSFVPKLSWLLVSGFLLRVRAKYLGDFHSLVAMFGLGAGSFILGVITLGLLLIEHPAAINAGLTIVMLFVFSSILLLMGMFFDRLENRGLETRIQE